MEGLIKGLSKGVKKGKVEEAKHITYMIYPAIEYAISFIDDGNSLILRGIIMIVDGDHYRLSLLHMNNEVDAKHKFDIFLKSFKLVANKYQPSTSSYHNDDHKISINPPKYWDIEKGKSPQIVAVVSNRSGHSITLLSASIAGYNCKSYQQELTRALGKLKITNSTINGKNAIVMKATAYDPTAKIEMTTIHYCIDLSNKVVVVLGGAPKDTFFRSEDIFTNVASSLKWQ